MVLGLAADLAGVEDAVFQHAHLAGSRVDALVNVQVVSSVGGDPAAEVLKLVDDGEARADGVDDVGFAIRSGNCDVDGEIDVAEVGPGAIVVFGHPKAEWGSNLPPSGPPDLVAALF